VLLSEGSGLTSRQVVTRLGQLGHEVELLSSTWLCLSRFTRHVRRIHRVPSFGTAPFSWFEAARAIARNRKIDVFLPTQEQVAVLSAMGSGALSSATVVPEFEALCRLQDKVSAYLTLKELGIPQPASLVAKDIEDLGRVNAFPAFVKQPISTASMGVRKVSCEAQLSSEARALGLGAQCVLIQVAAVGELAMVQALADEGRLIAHHACVRIKEGMGGGASIKESVTLRDIRSYLEQIVGSLRWHGPLSMDVICTARGPVVIDVNPRLVEPMNAYLAGVDLVGALLDLACGCHPEAQGPSKPGTRTCQLLLAVLGAAEREQARFAVARELWRALAHRGEYANATEELTSIAGDPLAAIPVLAAATATLLWPSLCRLFHSGAVANYSLTPRAWEEILSTVHRERAHAAA